jgi:S-adenosylmethionine hydrolase
VSALGAPLEDPVVRRTPEPRRLQNGAIAGEVIAIDRFGNAITNLVGVRGGTVEVGGVALPMARTYGDVASGDLTALCGSNGLIELAVRDGNAARLHGIRRGAQVLFRPATG